MNITKSARLPANVSSVTVSPETTSGREKSGAGVPSPSMVDSVAAISFYSTESLPGRRGAGRYNHDLIPGTAFVFPGQGSQSAGMGQALAAQYPAARRIFDEADDTL